MKSKLLALAILLTPFGANALGWQGIFVTTTEIQNEVQCAPRTCAMNDLATTYAGVCRDLGQFPRNTVGPRSHPSLQVISNSGQRSCICLCGTERIAEARKAAISSGATGLED